MNIRNPVSHIITIFVIKDDLNIEMSSLMCDWGSFTSNYCISSVRHGGHQLVPLLRRY